MVYSLELLRLDFPRAILYNLCYSSITCKLMLTGGDIQSV